AVGGLQAVGGGPVADGLVVGEHVAQLEVGLRRPVSHLGERLAQLAWRLVAPPVLVEDVEAEEPVERSARSPVLALDRPPPPGAAGDAELETGVVEAALGTNGQA